MSEFPLFDMWVCGQCRVAIAGITGYEIEVWDPPEWLGKKIVGTGRWSSLRRKFETKEEAHKWLEAFNSKTINPLIEVA